MLTYLQNCRSKVHLWRVPFQVCHRSVKKKKRQDKRFIWSILNNIHYKDSAVKKDLLVDPKMPQRPELKRTERFVGLFICVVGARPWVFRAVGHSSECLPRPSLCSTLWVAPHQRRASDDPGMPVEFQTGSKNLAKSSCPAYGGCHALRSCRAMLSRPGSPVLEQQRLSQSRSP